MSPEIEVVTPNLPTICIAADDFAKVSETFIARHLAQLNAGNTVGLARRNGNAGLGKPVLLWPRRGLFSPLRLFGKARRDFVADFSRFRRQHGVGVLLAEFGTVGADLFEAAKAIQLPMFCYFRGYDASKRLSDRNYRQKLRAMFEAIDGVVAVSQFLLDNLSAVGLRHANSLVIPSGVDTEMFRPGEKDGDLVLSVGRLVAKKAPLAVIRSFAAVAARFPTARLEMIGDGPLLRDVRRLVARLGLSQRVILHGAQRHDFIRERMSAASVFIQHSVTTAAGETEGAPSSIQEAMSAGTAVVASRHAGIPELITDKVTGLLVSEGDELGFSLALESLLGDAPLRLHLGEAARRHAVSVLDFRIGYRRLEQAIALALATRTAAYEAS